MIMDLSIGDSEELTIFLREWLNSESPSFYSPILQKIQWIYSYMDIEFSEANSAFFKKTMELTIDPLLERKVETWTSNIIQSDIQDILLLAAVYVNVHLPYFHSPLIKKELHSRLSILIPHFSQYVAEVPHCFLEIIQSHEFWLWGIYFPHLCIRVLCIDRSLIIFPLLIQFIQSMNSLWNRDGFHQIFPQLPRYQQLWVATGRLLLGILFTQPTRVKFALDCIHFDQLEKNYATCDIVGFLLYILPDIHSNLSSKDITALSEFLDQLQWVCWNGRIATDRVLADPLDYFKSLFFSPYQSLIDQIYSGLFARGRRTQVTLLHFTIETAYFHFKSSELPIFNDKSSQLRMQPQLCYGCHLIQEPLALISRGLNHLILFDPHGLLHNRPLFYLSPLSHVSLTHISPVITRYSVIQFTSPFFPSPEKHFPSNTMILLGWDSFGAGGILHYSNNSVIWESYIFFGNTVFILNSRNPLTFSNTEFNIPQLDLTPYRILRIPCEKADKKSTIMDILSLPQKSFKPEHVVIDNIGLTLYLSQDLWHGASIEEDLSQECGQWYKKFSISIDGTQSHTRFCYALSIAINYELLERKFGEELGDNFFQPFFSEIGHCIVNKNSEAIGVFYRSGSMQMGRLSCPGVLMWIIEDQTDECCIGVRLFSPSSSVITVQIPHILLFLKENSQIESFTPDPLLGHTILEINPPLNTSTFFHFLVDRGDIHIQTNEDHDSSEKESQNEDLEPDRKEEESNDSEDLNQEDILYHGPTDSEKDSDDE